MGFWGLCLSLAQATPTSPMATSPSKTAIDATLSLAMVSMRSDASARAATAGGATPAVRSAKSEVTP